MKTIILVLQLVSLTLWAAGDVTAGHDPNAPATDSATDTQVVTPGGKRQTATGTPAAGATQQPTEEERKAQAEEKKQKRIENINAGVDANASIEDLFQKNEGLEQELETFADDGKVTSAEIQSLGVGAAQATVLAERMNFRANMNGNTKQRAEAERALVVASQREKKGQLTVSERAILEDARRFDRATPGAEWLRNANGAMAPGQATLGIRRMVVAWNAGDKNEAMYQLGNMMRPLESAERRLFSQNVSMPNSELQRTVDYASNYVSGKRGPLSAADPEARAMFGKNWDDVHVPAMQRFNAAVNQFNNARDEKTRAEAYAVLQTFGAGGNNNLPDWAANNNTAATFAMGATRAESVSGGDATYLFNYRTQPIGNSQPVDLVANNQQDLSKLFAAAKPGESFSQFSGRMQSEATAEAPTEATSVGATATGTTTGTVQPATSPGTDAAQTAAVEAGQLGLSLFAAQMGTEYGLAASAANFLIDGYQASKKTTGTTVSSETAALAGRNVAATRTPATLAEAGRGSASVATVSPVRDGNFNPDAGVGNTFKFGEGERAATYTATGPATLESEKPGIAKGSTYMTFLVPTSNGKVRVTVRHDINVAMRARMGNPQAPITSVEAVR